MSDTEKPQDSPKIPVPDSARPARGSAPVRSLEHEQHYGSGPRLKELDAEIENELQEAMGSLTDKEMYGEPGKKRDQATAGEPGRKTARVLRVHGPDVFCDVPGGRSGGVLPLLQFPDGPPEVGTEVEVSIEGYDAANGLLVLS